MSTHPAKLRLPPLSRTATPPPPGHLSEEAGELWTAVLASYELDAASRGILERACESLDRIRQAQAALERDGLTVEGRFGPKLHPAAASERDSRTAFLRAIRELGLRDDALDLRYRSARSRSPDERGRVRPPLSALEDSA